jgi:hypothetical protein
MPRLLIDKHSPWVKPILLNPANVSVAAAYNKLPELIVLKPNPPDVTGSVPEMYVPLFNAIFPLLNTPLALERTAPVPRLLRVAVPVRVVAPARVVPAAVTVR